MKLRGNFFGPSAIGAGGLPGKIIQHWLSGNRSNFENYLWHPRS